MRIGVNVPDDLLRRLDVLKPELNISQVCREAVLMHVERYEAAAANLDTQPTKSALEEAGREEIASWSVVYVDWEALGYEDAVSWGASATWEDWTEWRKAQEFLERQNRPAWAIQPRLRSEPHGATKTFNDRRNDFHDHLRKQSDEYIEWLDYQGITTDWEAAERDYGRARVAYLRKAWQIICDRREEHFQRQREELLAKRRVRLEPTIPAYMLPENES